MLGLKLATDPRWVNLAEMQLEEILTDHAYCEQKAVSSCISIIQDNPEREKLVGILAPIVTEEWGHFRMVLAELKKRNLKLGRQRKDEYVSALKKLEIKGGSRETYLLDRLLMQALIEARSCERFRLLSEQLKEEDLRKFYRGFMEAEALHYTTFMDLAKEYIAADVVYKRWDEILNAEIEILNNLALRGDRMH